MELSSSNDIERETSNTTTKYINNSMHYLNIRDDI